MGDMPSEQEQPAPVSEEEYFKDVNNVYNLLSVEAIEISAGN